MELLGLTSSSISLLSGMFTGSEELVPDPAEVERDRPGRLFRTISTRSVSLTGLAHRGHSVCGILAWNRYSFKTTHVFALGL